MIVSTSSLAGKHLFVLTLVLSILKTNASSDIISAGFGFSFALVLNQSLLRIEASTFEPSLVPSILASAAPSVQATVRPSIIPSSSPTGEPSIHPSSSPSDLKSSQPTSKPSRTASSEPTSVSSSKPSSAPTLFLSQVPTNVPSTSSPPTIVASSKPTTLPSNEPSSSPTLVVSQMPTSAPSTSSSPTTLASNEPSSVPSIPPTVSFNPTLSAQPTTSDYPSVQPSSHATNEPSITSSPSAKVHSPSDVPSGSYNCVDSTKYFFWENSQGLMRRKNCAFVANDPEKKCLREEAKENCPVTCNTCPSPTSVPSTHGPSMKVSTIPTLNHSNVPSFNPSSKYSNPPSATPTVHFSESPSYRHSKSPSANPTMEESSTPSSSPSTLHSSSPSIEPSTSHSFQPSIHPSRSPTSEKSYDTDVVLGFEGFSVVLNDDVKSAFEDITKAYLTSSMKTVDGVEIEITSISIYEKLDVDTIKDGIQNKRMLQESEAKGMMIVLDIEAIVRSKTSLPNDFSFSDVILNGLYDNFPVYKSLLSEDKTISTAMKGSGDNNAPEKVESRSLSFYIYIGCSVAGAILIAFLTILFIKHRNDRELVRLPSNLTFQDENEFIRSQGKVGIPYGGNLSRNGSRLNEIYAQYQGSSSRSNIVSDPVGSGSQRIPQNLTRSGSSRRSSISGHPGGMTQSTNHPFMTWQGSFGELQFSAPSNQDRSRSYSTRGENSRSGIPRGMPYATNDSRNHMDHNMPRTLSDSSSGSLGLNVSPNALKEAQRQRRQQFSFVPQERNSIRSLYPDDIDISDLDCISFDHDCPPGPLGVMIDTTTRGPMIHGVKQNSVLFGIVAPGDIIVALDGKDTTTMTAPLITSLMASKSQQRRRRLKILRYQ